MDDKKNKKRKSPLITALLVLLIVGTVGTVAAKYVFSTQIENLFRAKEFYFTSDTLTEISNPETETGTEYTINYDAENIVFSISNAADELRFSEDDVVYTIDVKKKSGTDWTDCGASVSYTTGGTLAKGGVNTAQITVSGIQTGGSVTDTYKVTVTATMGKNLEKSIYGYKKVMAATFVPSQPQQTIYKHLKKDTLYDAYVVLTVWTKDLKAAAPDGVDIAYPAGGGTVKLVPDNTDAILHDVYLDAGDSIAFSDKTNFAEAYSSRSYRFFVTDGDIDDITAENFSVMIGSQTASTATP